MSGPVNLAGERRGSSVNQGVSLDVGAAVVTAELLNLFLFLEDSGVEYCLLGDSGAHPGDGGGDVDIVVSNDTLVGLKELIAQYCEVAELQLVQCIQHEAKAWYFVLAKMTLQSRPRFLKLDFCSDYQRNARTLIASERLLTKRYRNEWGVFVPKASEAFNYYLIKRVSKRSIDNVHGEYLHSLWLQDPAGCERCTFDIWAGAGAELVKRAAETNDWKGVVSDLEILASVLSRKFPLTINAVLQESRRVFQRVREPTGISIAFIGPDGAGKSTILAAVGESLLPAFRRRDIHYVTAGPLGRQDKKPMETSPHRLPPRGWLGSIAKLGYLLTNVWMGHAMHVLPGRIGSTLVLFDRYFYDIEVDPLRHRYGGPQWLVRAVRRFVPSPDLLFLLDAPVAVVQARKQEVAVSETLRQRSRYLDVVESIRSAIVIEASQPADEVLAAIESEILLFMATREGRRGRGCIGW